MEIMGMEQIKNIRHGNFKDWFADCMETGNNEEIELMPVIMWNIWKSRNEMVFDGKERGAALICNYIQDFLQHFKAAQLNRMISSGY